MGVSPQTIAKWTSGEMAAYLEGIRSGVKSNDGCPARMRQQLAQVADAVDIIADQCEAARHILSQIL